MKKTGLYTAVAAAVALTASAAFAVKEGMEKCNITDSHGKGMIKAHKADCKSAKGSCAGTNKAGDPSAWIAVPKGLCTSINTISKAGAWGKMDVIKSKIEDVKKDEKKAS